MTCKGSPLGPGRKVYRDILNSILFTISSCPTWRWVSLLCRKLPQHTHLSKQDACFKEIHKARQINKGVNLSPRAIGHTRGSLAASTMGASTVTMQSVCSPIA